MKIMTIAAIVAGILAASAAHAEPIWIKNRWKVDQYLNTQPGQVITSDVEDSWKSGQWEIIDAGGGFVWAQNKRNNCYLHVERGKVECTTDVQRGWLSAQWSREDKAGGFFLVKNRWKNCYLNIEKGPVLCTAIKAGWTSAQWMIEE